MTEPESADGFTAQDILDQSDPILMAFRVHGQAAATAHKHMMENGMSEDVADSLIKDLCHQFWKGLYNKDEGLQMPKLPGSDE